MIRLLAAVALIACMPGCEACGYSSRGNELTGQVKKVVQKTPIACPDYYQADVSLGVMRNGVGSMSHEDVVMTVVDPRDVELLTKAAKTGAIVDVTYDVRRATFCIEDHLLTGVKFADGAPAPVGSAQ